jgi:hypothetical protein
LAATHALSARLHSNAAHPRLQLDRIGLETMIARSAMQRHVAITRHAAGRMMDSAMKARTVRWARTKTIAAPASIRVVAIWMAPLVSGACFKANGSALGTEVAPVDGTRTPENAELPNFGSAKVLEGVILALHSF